MRLYIIGAGGFAREVAWVAQEDKSLRTSEFIFLSDDKSQWGKQLIFGDVVGSIDSQPIDYCSKFIVAVGSPELRRSLVARALEKKWRPHSAIIHKQSFIGDVVVGAGSIICSMCSITTNVTVGEYVNVNLNCTIGHDAILEDYVNLSPHCTISGKVHIKKGADLGSAATVLPGVTIGENAVIGAGAVVTKDIPDNCTAVGIPAKVIKQNA